MIGHILQELLSFCLNFRGHPETNNFQRVFTIWNVAPSLFWGFIAAYIKTESIVIDTSIKAIVCTLLYPQSTIKSINCVPILLPNILFNLLHFEQVK